MESLPFNLNLPIVSWNFFINFLIYSIILLIVKMNQSNIKSIFIVNIKILQKIEYFLKLLLFLVINWYRLALFFFSFINSFLIRAIIHIWLFFRQIITFFSFFLFILFVFVLLFTFLLTSKTLFLLKLIFIIIDLTFFFIFLLYL